MLRPVVIMLAVSALVVLVGELALSLSDCEKKPDANAGPAKEKTPQHLPAAPADVKRRIIT